METNNRGITKTIIRGTKQIKRLVGISYDFKHMPRLNYATHIVESNAIVQEIDFDLIVDVGDSISRYNMNRKLSIVINGNVELVDIILSRLENGIHTIVVDKILEEEEQRFNYDDIMRDYENKLSEYWEVVIQKYKNNKPKVIEIKTWLNNGMTKEEILNVLFNNVDERNEIVEYIYQNSK